MNLNTQGVSRNGNQGSTSTSRLQPVPSRKGLGYTRSDTSEVGAGSASSTRPCVEASAPDPRHSHGVQASGSSPCATEKSETITHQGQTIVAELVAELGGWMGTLLGQGRNGGDELFRDQEGRYEFQHEAEEAGAFFARVHRINLNAAILWAIGNLGSDAWGLRCDAADLLTENQSSLLDDHVVGLLRTHAADNPEDDLRDVVNGYLAATLECVRHDRSASSGISLAEARARRLASEADTRQGEATATVPLHSTAQLSQFGRARLAKGPA